QPRRYRTFVVGWGKAKDIRIEEEAGAFARPEGVSVDAYDTGEGAPVWVKGRGRIVRFNLKRQVVLVIKLDDPCVVLEYGKAEILLSGRLADSVGRCGNAGLEKTVDHRCPAVLPVVDDGVEYLVLAVLRPGLGQRLQD